MARPRKLSKGAASLQADAPLSEVATALRAGSISSRFLVERAVQRRDAVSSVLDAYTHWAPSIAFDMAACADEAFLQGRELGLLQGIPVSIKDVFSLEGMPMHVGSARALPDRYRAEGGVVRALRSQGAVFMGKTHTSEMAFGVCGHNVHWGTPRNPWDAHAIRPAGGSSSGAALSILEGSALVAMGSDSGGSVREPANMTGIVGLKVTQGRWPSDGLIPPGPNFHGPGLITRTVSDAAFAFHDIDMRLRGDTRLDISKGVDLPDLRIGILGEDYWLDCAPGIAEAVEAGLRELVQAGARVFEFELPEVQELRSVSPEWDFGISAVELHEFLVGELPGWWDDLHPDARAQISRHIDMAAVEYIRRCRLLVALRASASRRLSEVDIVVCPSSPISAPLLADLSKPDVYSRINRLAARNMCVANQLDLCALTMPVGLDREGLPVGMHLMSANSGDAGLLRAATAFEKVLGTGRKRLGIPPLLRGLAVAV